MQKQLPYLLWNNVTTRNFSEYESDEDFKHALLKQLHNNFKISHATKNILIFSSRTDFEIDHLGISLIAHRIDYTRVNFEDILENKYSFNIDFTKKDNEFYIKAKNKTYYIQNFDYIWFRHFAIFQNNESLESENKNYINDFYVQEWMEFFKSISQIYSDKMLTPFYTDNNYTKPFQLLVAKKYGFNIPKAIISNDSNEISKKASKWKDVLVKAIKHHSLYYYPSTIVDFYAKTFNMSSFPPKKRLELIPEIFQQDLNTLSSKANVSEYRISVFTDFVVAYQYQNILSADWHNDDIQNIKLMKTTIPSKLKEKILQYNSFLKLKFSTFDFLKVQNSWYF